MALISKKNRNTRSPRGNLDSQFRRGNPAWSKAQRQQRRLREENTLRQQYNYKKHQKHRRVMWVSFSLLILMIAVFGYQLSISKVTVASKSTSISKAEISEYESIASDFTDKIFLKQSWLVDEQELKEVLKKSAPEIKEVNTSSRLPFSRELKLDVIFRKPLFIWQDASQTKRYLDEEGVLFSKNIDGISEKSLITVEDSSGLVVKSGSVAVSSATAEIISGLPVQLKDIYKQGRVVKKIEVPKSTRELRVYPEGEKYYIKFNTDRKIEEQVGDLKETLNYLRKNRQQVKQYIDVRIAEKAFYK